MYHSELVERLLNSAKKNNMKFVRRPYADCIAIAADLEKLRQDPTKPDQLLPDNRLQRALTNGEKEFINSELILSKCDAKYWMQRYCSMELDPGVGSQSGIGPPILLPSQLRYHELIGRRQLESFKEMEKYKFSEGVLCYFHKVRQVAATAYCRGLAMHRMTFWPGTRAFAASLDDTRKGELYTRDKIILDNMPFWMKPKLFPDVKATEIGFETPINSRISYQAENQSSGIGVGSQNDISHLTEVALWRYPGRIRYSFVPSMPKAVSTLHVQESTADGKGNYWHEVTEAARHRKKGFENWIYAFIPWYMNRTKYRAIPPPEWKMSEHTRRHLELIERTSPEFFDGVKQTPSMEQMFWWERTRAEHAHDGELATFLTNYPATPEQSFQTPNQGALPTELIEKLEMNLWDGIPYEVQVR